MSFPIFERFFQKLVWLLNPAARLRELDEEIEQLRKTELRLSTGWKPESNFLLAGWTLEDAPSEKFQVSDLKFVCVHHEGEKKVASDILRQRASEKGSFGLEALVHFVGHLDEFPSERSLELFGKELVFPQVVLISPAGQRYLPRFRYVLTSLTSSGWVLLFTAGDFGSNACVPCLDK